MRFIKMKGLSIFNNHLIDYPTPIVGYLNSFGSLSGLCLIIQIITGILLAAHYTPHILFAFTSVEHIIRDVNDGWRHLRFTLLQFFQLRRRLRRLLRTD